MSAPPTGSAATEPVFPGHVHCLGVRGGGLSALAKICVILLAFSTNVAEPSGPAINIAANAIQAGQQQFLSEMLSTLRAEWRDLEGRLPG